MWARRRPSPSRDGPRHPLLLLMLLMLLLMVMLLLLMLLLAVLLVLAQVMLVQAIVKQPRYSRSDRPRRRLATATAPLPCLSAGPENSPA